MGSGRFHRPILDQGNLIGLPHGGDAMSDDNNGLFSRLGMHMGADKLLVVCVQGGG